MAEDNANTNRSSQDVFNDIEQMMKDLNDPNNPSNKLKTLLQLKPQMVIIDSMDEVVKAVSPATKFQLTCWDISGRVYKQGLYQTKTKAYSAQKSASKKYGAYLRFQIDEVSASQKRPTAVASVGSQYCFCPDTPLYVNKCSKCGKSPYTD